MKSPILVLLLTLSLFACDSNDTSNNNNDPKTEPTSTDSIPSPRTYYLSEDSSMMQTIGITYYPNGKIESISEGGEVNTCGTPVGTHYYFDEAGNLTKQIRYDVWIKEPNEGCHASVIQDQYITEFYPSRKLKSKKQLQSVYEGEEYKFGYWLEYDESGKLTKEEYYERHFKK